MKPSWSSFQTPSYPLTLSANRNFNFSAVHALGAERLARVTAQCGVPRFVHVSHLNADLHSPSQFYQSKAEGEQLVKQAFDGPTIVRPSTMFGYEDKLLTNMAGE
jgi:NADH dehydrogenase (ubiquinone) 1 alpha subcomplex subunit 9